MVADPDIPPAVRLGAVLYTAETGDRGLLARFAGALRSRGWRVGGLVQEVLRDADGRRVGVDAVALDGDERIALARASPADLEHGTCGLDVAALAASSAALRRAVAGGADLILVEKFGEREQRGDGLADDILAAAAGGVPTLVAVPAGAIEHWRRFTGGMDRLLPWAEAALWRWWGPGHAIEELVRNTDEAPAARVVVGLNWTLVEGPRGCGLAQSPGRDTPGCRPVPGAAGLAGRSLRDLAAMAHSWNPFEAAIGMAAVNAHFNRYDLRGAAVNGLDLFVGVEGPVTAVGRFPGLARRLPGVRVIERTPAEGEYPEAAAAALLAASEAVVVTAAALVNRTFPALVEAAAGARVALVGPGTPLAPALHAYGVEALAGLVVEDPEGAARAVAEGGAVKALRPFCRNVTLVAADDSRG